MKRKEVGLNFILTQDQSSPQDFGKARGHSDSAFQMKKKKHQAMFQHVYLVVFSLLVERIPVPDLKLHKVSSVLSQAATISMNQAKVVCLA